MAYGEGELMRITAPAGLVAKARYSDKSSAIPNNTIDAGETAVFLFKAANKGKGIAFSAELHVDSSSKHIRFKSRYELGDIAPGKSKEVRVPVRASVDLPDGKTDFTFKITEKRCYDARPQVVRVPTCHIDHPKLSISSYEINDGVSGLAKGNANGVPENGETIELAVFVTNREEGDAFGVTLTLQDIVGGIELVQKEAILDKVGRGMISRGKLAFHIPRTFSGKDIPFKLNVSDMRVETPRP